MEVLEGQVSHVVFSGRRAEDMALRFKYAGVIGPGPATSWKIDHDTERAFRLALQATPAPGTLFIVPTYTAMLEVRGVLARLGYVKQYWEE
jgi:UDP-N-acetylmuramyl tripeptide synthase